MRLPAFLLAVAVLVSTGPLFAQQGVTKPVITAAPEAPPAVGVPAQAAPPPAVAGPVTDAAAQAPAGSATYVISRGDTLQITVWRETTISGVFPVRPDGMISLSLIGDIPAAGFTPMGLSTDIATRLKKYINDPNVTVTVTSVRPKEIYLIGEVQHVGPIALLDGMSVLQAIAAGGGVTPYANTKKIYILRGEAGHQTKIPFDYKKALDGDSQQGISLLAGDTIVVR